MTYSEAKLAEYPPQDESQLLIEFTAELLARRQFAGSSHPSVTWNDWIGNNEEVRGISMAPYRAHAADLADLGMLSWPDTETIGIIWTVEGPGADRGQDAAPALDWIKSFARNAKRAVAYYRACNVTGQPCRLSWSFPPKRGLDLA